jgi:hypothetical protein
MGVQGKNYLPKENNMTPIYFPAELLLLEHIALSGTASY